LDLVYLLKINRRAMIRMTIYLYLLFLLSTSIVFAQDTFSIVALDTVTGEVGSAGASCVDMSNFPGYDDDFLGELFPGVGAINTQAWYLPANQANARDRMNEGYTPAEIIQWLVENDVQNQPEKRQYVIVAFVDDSTQSAGHTGVQTDDYKNHVLGSNYAIQGNILLGQEILDSMEARFLNAPGDLACKLMAALQGANVVGADTRCTPNGTSSLFAFVKVAQPDDIFGSPSFVVSVRTTSTAGIEPIDTLQVLFSMVHECSGVGMNENERFNSLFKLYPNPVENNLVIENSLPGTSSNRVSITDISGALIFQGTYKRSLNLDVSSYAKGIYFIKISHREKSYTGKFIKE